MKVPSHPDSGYWKRPSRHLSEWCLTQALDSIGPMVSLCWGVSERSDLRAPSQLAHRRWPYGDPRRFVVAACSSASRQEGAPTPDACRAAPGHTVQEPNSHVLSHRPGEVDETFRFAHRFRSVPDTTCRTRRASVVFLVANAAEACNQPGVDVRNRVRRNVTDVTGTWKRFGSRTRDRGIHLEICPIFRHCFRVISRDQQSDGRLGKSQIFSVPVRSGSSWPI